MARIRTIKPEFWTHEDLSGLPEATHMLAAALLNHADDEGYFHAHHGLIKAACLPLREPSVSIHDSLNLLCGIGYLSLFKAADGKSYGRVNSFDLHQRVNRPTPSKIKSLGLIPECSVQTHTQLTEDSSPERKGTGKGREQGNGKEQTSPTAQSLSTATPPTDLLGGSQKPADLPAKRAERISAITADAIEAYNRILGKPNGLLRAVRASVGIDSRREQVKRCLKTASEICQELYGDSRITPEFWKAYFESASESDFHSGKGPYRGEHENWRPDFDYLTKKNTMLKLFDRAVDEDGEEAA